MSEIVNIFERTCFSYHPQIEGTPTPSEWLNNSAADHWGNTKNDALRIEYEKLLANGVSNVHYVFANDLFVYGGHTLTPGPEGRDVNPTVAGIHSSDLGQYEIASYYIEMLPQIIS